MRDLLADISFCVVVVALAIVAGSRWATGSLALFVGMMLVVVLSHGRAR